MSHTPLISRLSIVCASHLLSLVVDTFTGIPCSLVVDAAIGIPCPVAFDTATGISWHSAHTSAPLTMALRLEGLATAAQICGSIP